MPKSKTVSPDFEKTRKAIELLDYLTRSITWDILKSLKDGELFVKQIQKIVGKNESEVDRVLCILYEWGYLNKNHIAPRTYYSISSKFVKFCIKFNSHKKLWS